MLIYHALQNPANQNIAKRGYVSKETVVLHQWDITK